MKIQLPLLAALAAASLSFQAMADCVSVETSATSAQAQAPVRTATAPAPASSKNRSTAVILRPVALRDRPTNSGTGDVVASADTPVRLERGIKNADGNWWFVTAPGLGGGWVQTSDMANLPQM